MDVSEFLKIADNKFGTIAEESVVGDVDRWIDSGSYTLNAVVSGSIYGGLPGNKIVALVGAESTGKTFFALASCKNFLDSNPTGIVLYFETESALTQEMLKSRKIDLRRFGILPVATVQEFKNQCLKIVNNQLEQKQKNPLLIVLDSLGNLSTTKEMEDSAEGNDTRDMTRAQMLKAAFRVLSLKLGAASIPLIMTNHVYAAIGQGPYAAAVQSGGSGSKYAASIIINLTKAKEKDGDEVVGSVVTCTAVKSRLTKENSKVKTLIRYSGGLDRYYGLIDLAEKAGVITKVSTRYELPNGTKVFSKALNNNPEKYWTKEMLDAVDEYVKKEFRYGVAFDEENAEIDISEEVEENEHGKV